MAVTPRARGANFKLYKADESTEGSRPASGWTQLPCYSFGLNANAPLQEDQVLSTNAGRGGADPYVDILTVSGDAAVPVDCESFGHWCKLLFGAPTSTDHTTYQQHVFVTGALILPSWTVEQAFPDAGRYFERNGVKANTLSIDLGTSGRPQAKIGLMGLKAPAAANATITSNQVAAGLVPVRQAIATITDGTNPIASYITGGTLNFSNNLEEFRQVGDGGAASGIDVGLVSVSGSLTQRFSDTTLAGYATSATPKNVVITWSLSATRAIAITMPRVFFEVSSPAVSGPNGVEVTTNFRGAPDPVTGLNMSVTLINGLPGY